MSLGGIGSSLGNMFDPLDLTGQAGSSVIGNIADPSNFFGMNNNAGFTSGSGATGTQLPTSSSGYPTYSANLPGSFSNAGYDSPSMTGYGYGYYGGMAPIPEGGYYNQMAQAMAGPSYAPVGSSWETLAPGQAWNSPASGYTPSSGASGSKGGKGAQTGTQMTSGGATSTTGTSPYSPNGTSNGSKGGLMSPFPIGQPPGYGSNPTIPWSIHPSTGQMYTSAPQPGQPLRDLGTGLNGESTYPSTPVSAAPTGNFNPITRSPTTGSPTTGYNPTLQSRLGGKIPILF